MHLVAWNQFKGLLSLVVGNWGIFFQFPLALKVGNKRGTIGTSLRKENGLLNLERRGWGEKLSLGKIGLFLSLNFQGILEGFPWAWVGTLGEGKGITT